MEQLKNKIATAKATKIKKWHDVNKKWHQFGGFKSRLLRQTKRQKVLNFLPFFCLYGNFLSRNV